MILRRIYAYVSMESLCRYNIERILFPRVCDVRVSIILIRNSRDRVLFETTMISFSFFFFKRPLRRVGRRSTVAGYYRSIRCPRYFLSHCETRTFFLSHDSPQKFAVRKFSTRKSSSRSPTLESFLRSPLDGTRRRGRRLFFSLPPAASLSFSAGGKFGESRKRATLNGANRRCRAAKGCRLKGKQFSWKQLTAD